MKEELIFAVLGLSTVADNGNSDPSGSQPPNIVLIIGDDIGWNDLSYYGNNRFQTPNIDRITNEGTKFTNAFLTTSSSSSSQSSIITGRYPHNTGAAELHTPLPVSVETFPILLKKASYYTAAGKLHMGAHAKRGFDLVKDEGPRVNGDGGEKIWVNLLRKQPKEKPSMWLLR